MDKIYSRKRFNIYKIPNKFQKNTKVAKLIKITIVIIMAIVTSKLIIVAINPIFNKQCENISKSIATKICNEQATKVMGNYKYEDLCTITKDSNGYITMISANIIAINEIISDIPIKIQDELNKSDNSKLKIPLGSFTSSKLLSGVGPNIEIKINTIGNLDTDLRSEFISAGINQTVHKIYLQIDCNVIVLTPFDTIEQRISNQVLLAEAVIVGTTPNTYYNLEGITMQESLETIE